MTEAEIREWVQVLMPLATVFATIYVAWRVNHVETKIDGRMDQLIDLMRKDADARVAKVLADVRKPENVAAAVEIVKTAAQDAARILDET